MPAIHRQPVTAVRRDPAVRRLWQGIKGDHLAEQRERVRQRPLHREPDPFRRGKVCRIWLPFR